MALTFKEIESVTSDYFSMKKKEASDIYFKTSFLLDYLMKKKNGLFELVAGGERFRVPLEYDESNGGSYSRSDSLSSDDKEIINAAYFYAKHYYGNATIMREDELKNEGPYAEVKLVTSKIANAQKTAANWLAKDIYGNTTDGAKALTGVTAMCFGAAATAYGGVVENDLVSADGNKFWKATNTTTTEGITLPAIRTLASTAKIYDGPAGKPDIGVCSETLFNIVAGILQVQQRFTEGDSVNAGFRSLVFEGKVIAADDFCPSGYLFLFNTEHIGFHIYKSSYFVRTPWMDLLPSRIPAKTMDILWDGNIVTDNRKSHAAHSNLS